MRGFMFRDQVNVISSYFGQWNQCEQLVCLYALIQKLSVTQSKFLKMVLQQSLSQDNDFEHIEIEANDPEFIRSLCNKPKDYVVETLLSHLPLLHPENEHAKSQYMLLIPQVLQHSMENRVHIDESRHLLSYTVIHPAISANERRSLTLWMQNLEETIKNNQNSQISSTMKENVPHATGQWQQETPGLDKVSTMYSSLRGLGSRSLPAGLGTQLSNAIHYSNIATNQSRVPSTVADNSEEVENENSSAQRPFIRRRSKSYSPIISSYIASNVQNDENSQTKEDANKKKVNHVNDQAPLSPQGSIASSGSSEGLEENKNSFNPKSNGMKDVLGWLKSLRLHKYSHLFAQMTYNEMMNLTEGKLEQQNVTKGARHKIVLSIQKLKDRPETIRSLKKSIMDGENLKEALTELRNLIQTPIKAYRTEEKCLESHPDSPPLSPSLNDCIPDEDIPSQLTNIMGKMCTQLLVVNCSDDENFSTYIMLVDKCLSHDAFTPTQKRRLFSWKQQVQKVWHPLPPRRSLDSRLNRSNISHNVSTLPNRRRVPTSQRITNSPLNKPASMPPIVSQHQQNCSSGLKQTASLSEPVKPAMMNIQRRNSAPVRSNQLSVTPTYKPVHEVVDPEIDTRLRSLCLSVTEHALAGSDCSNQY